MKLGNSAKYPFLILDGPTGTQLAARGLELHPSLWTAQAATRAPGLLKQIHLDYLKAGANLITANTFRSSSYAALKAGHSAKEALRWTHASIALATEAIEEVDPQNDVPAFLGASLAPLEDCYQPRLTPPLKVLEEVHHETASWLVEAGCDFILVETMGTTAEAVTAVRAARRAQANNILVSFITDPLGQKLLGGDSLFDAAIGCIQSGAQAVLVNCVHADVVDLALPVLETLRESGVAIGAYPNASRMNQGYGGSITWESDGLTEDQRVADYADRGVSWMKNYGASILGSCCGTSPAYIQALSAALKRTQVKK